MSERVRLSQEADLSRDCCEITAPTLALTGEPGLDRVVPPNVTREYLETIGGCRHTVLEGTGHIGLVTRADEFARVVSAFVARAVAESTAPATPRGRRIPA
jgi:pimeloyl-ACP methyl ester carboxylesterase